MVVGVSVSVALIFGPAPEPEGSVKGAVASGSWNGITNGRVGSVKGTVDSGSWNGITNGRVGSVKGTVDSGSWNGITNGRVVSESIVSSSGVGISVSLCNFLINKCLLN